MDKRIDKKMDKRINVYSYIRINPTNVPYGSVAWMITREITRSSELWSVCVVLCRSSHIHIYITGFNGTIYITRLLRRFAPIFYFNFEHVLIVNNEKQIRKIISRIL